ncbi:MAG: CinA family protein [Ruminococcus sp.]|nr:CinA family protein [Ruminococcus sp.]
MIENRITIAAAESCTGGLLSAMITSVPGASEIYPGGLCSYSEEIKMKLLGVKKKTLDRYSVYSAETAREMSAGAVKLFGTDCGIGITGIAGPGGGTEDKPVGTVFISVRYKDRELSERLRVYEEYEDPTREKIRETAAVRALLMARELTADRSEVEDHGNV